MLNARFLCTLLLVAATASCTRSPESPAAAQVPSPPALDVVELSAADARDRMAAGTLTSRALTQAYLDRIAEVDDAGLIVRHSYTAEAFGRWAKGDHRSTRFITFDGLPVPTRRRVHLTPIGPVAVKVDVSDAAWA